MCRMFAVLGHQPLDLAPYLVTDGHSLGELSRCDRRGQSHPDGWGIGVYEQDKPLVARGARAAHEDPQFAVTARRARSRMVMAHVRQKSVGPVDIRNNHPFAHSAWMFAHNGTLTGFASVEKRLLADIDPDLRGLRVGSTDSELVFLWLLAQLRRAGQALNHEARDPRRVAAILRDSTRKLHAWCEPDDEGTARLNFFLTDGSRLFATRMGRSLHWLQVGEVSKQNSPAAILVASEPLTDEAWREIDDASMLTVESDLATRFEPL